MTNHWLKKQQEVDRKLKTMPVKLDIKGKVPMGFKMAIENRRDAHTFVSHSGIEFEFEDDDAKPPKEDNNLQQPIGDKYIVFPRKFRYTFVPDTCEKVSQFVQTCHIDHKNKVIKMEIMDQGDSFIYDWITSNDDDEACESAKSCNKYDYSYQLESISCHRAKRTATINLWDGCGNLLCKYFVKGLRLTAHETSLDYASSDVVNHVIEFKCTEISRM